MHAMHALSQLSYSPAVGGLFLHSLSGFARVFFTTAFFRAQTPRSQEIGRVNAGRPGVVASPIGIDGTGRVGPGVGVW